MILLFWIGVPILTYLTGIAIWVSFCAWKVGQDGVQLFTKRPKETVYHNGRAYQEVPMTEWEKRAAWSPIWPLALPAMIVAAPFVGIFGIVAAFSKLFDHIHKQSLEVTERKKTLQLESTTTVVTKTTPLRKELVH